MFIDWLSVPFSAFFSIEILFKKWRFEEASAAKAAVSSPFSDE